MFFPLKLAVRFLLNGHRGLVRFTALSAFIGIAAGVASLIIAQAVAAGFQSELQGKILTNTPQISIFLADGGQIENWLEIEKDLASVENVNVVKAGDHGSALINGPMGSAYAEIKTDTNVNEIKLGAELAKNIGLEDGSAAEIVAVENGGMPKTSAIKIGQLLKTGMFDYDATWLLVPPNDFAAIFGGGEFRPTVLIANVDDVYVADKTAAIIRERLGGKFRVVDWQEANQPLFAALSFERKAATIVILLIMLVAILGVTTTLALLVNERRHDIAVLRTCGLKTRQLAMIFISEGLLLGSVGIAVGVLFGLGFCAAANYFGLISLSAEVYLISQINLRASLIDIAAICAAAFSLCFVAALYPALMASRIRPAENLRSV